MSRASARREAIVLVDHGSRRPEANAQLEALAEAVAAQRPDALVRIAHLEIAEPDPCRAIDECVREGASRVIVHPFFLGPGRHTQEDIPRLVERSRQMHPAVEIVVSAPLGLHEGIVTAVLARIEVAGLQDAEG